MKKKLLSLSSLLIGFLGFSQTEVYFKYDEAGNQRYRGVDVNAKQASETLAKAESKTASLTQPDPSSIKLMRKHSGSKYDCILFQ